MNSVGTLLRFSGRLARGAFLFRVFLIFAAFALLDAALRPVFGNARVWLLNPVTLWALLASMVQRLHDRDRSGWWLFAAAIPVLGAAWLLWQCFSRGVRSDNRWGVDPLRETRDFLVVG